MVVAVIGIGSSVAEAQGAKIAPPYVGIVAKQPIDCDPQWACPLEAKVNDLAKRLDVAKKDNALRAHRAFECCRARRLPELS